MNTWRSSPKKQVVRSRSVVIVEWWRAVVSVRCQVKQHIMACCHVLLISVKFPWWWVTCRYTLHKQTVRNIICEAKVWRWWGEASDWLASNEGVTVSELAALLRVSEMVLCHYVPWLWPRLKACFGWVLCCVVWMLCYWDARGGVDTIVAGGGGGGCWFGGL